MPEVFSVPEEGRRAVRIDTTPRSSYTLHLMNADAHCRNTSGVGRGKVLRTAIFMTVLAGTLFGDGAVAVAQIDASPSSFRLVGTIESGPFTGAVIDDTQNPQVFYRLSQRLPDGSQIVEVHGNYIVLKEQDGTRTELYATPGAGGPRVPVASPAAAPRRADAPTPEQRMDLIRRRAAEARANPSAGSGPGPMGGRSSQMDRQRPDRSAVQGEDRNVSKRGSRGRHRRSRLDDDN